MSWNKSAEAYRPFEAFTKQFSTAAVDELREAPERLMDVAAGTGASTFAVCEKLATLCEGKCTEVVATDFSEDMLQALKKKLTAEGESEDSKITRKAIEEGLLKVSAELADAQDLSKYEAESFDAVTCTFGIMFPPSPEKVVKEFWRLLKPGGVAITTTWHYNNSVAEILPDLAHEFMGRGRFEELPLVASTLKFGTEIYMRRLFRGDLGDGKLWSDADLELRFVSGSATCLPQHMAFFLNKNPVSADLGTWDEAKAERRLEEKWANEAGEIKLQGTALILVARKPL